MYNDVGLILLNIIDMNVCKEGEMEANTDFNA
jgi:hypothetical protein